MNMDTSSQYFYAFIDGQQVGPYDLQNVRRLIGENKIVQDTLVWTEGMEAWAQASQVHILKSLFPPPAPIPFSAPVPPPVNQQVSQEDDEPKLYIKCINCGEVYTVDVNDYSENDNIYSCKCGNQIGVRFFGYCRDCDAHIGFVDDPNKDSLLGSIVKGAIKGYLNPIEGIKGLTRFVDSIPDAETYGICPNCGKKYLECPNCREAVPVPKDADIQTDIFICPNCKTKTRHP